MLECKNLALQDQGLTSPTSPISTLSDAPTLLSQLSIASDTTVVAPALVSPFEAKHYWHGISGDPPELLYRSDLESNPFPRFEPKARFSQLPVKTVSGTWGTAMNDQVWREVAPLIVALFKERHIAYSALMTVRFSIEDEDGKKVTGPLVVWVALHPSYNTASDARDISPDVLNILVEHGVEGAVVEWYHGSVERLTGPPLLRVTNDTNPSYYVSRPLTAALGMPIATKEMEADDAQGSVTFFFHENCDKDGAPSSKVFGVSNKHVLRKDTTVHYELKGTGAPRQYVRVCGDRRYKRFVADTRALIDKNVDDSLRLAEEVARLEEKPKSTDEDEAADDASALKKKKAQLEEAEEACVALEDFLKTSDASFHDIAQRGVGWVHWAPKIAIDVDANRYTLDIGTFELDPSKFSNNSFKGNVVDLGAKFEPHELHKMFWPNDTNASGLKFPPNRQLQIRGVVTRELLANPDCYDDGGNAMYVVAKDGNTTDLTVGRYTGLEAYLCDEFGKESIEVAIYNYSKTSENFSAKGDSGSLIFTGDGRMLAVLHSGMPRGLSNHVTFGTPAWWVVDRLKSKYKYADFNRDAF
ncbi:hypothetical protein BJ322DRAFT_996293 [Thelephora terrestris]|uniref:Uncharacterized protein n=1 Tax=Thelephora terrestris TaxID=56493 RepID=A0A9P6LDQ4_9AGAM|nr:hypothetical protein BJ322DRAFT_996293 [Thelephora terrestris]